MCSMVYVPFLIIAVGIVVILNLLDSPLISFSLLILTPSFSRSLTVSVFPCLFPSLSHFPSLLFLFLGVLPPFYFSLPHMYMQVIAVSMKWVSKIRYMYM